MVDDKKKIADGMIEQLSGIHGFCKDAKKSDDLNKKLLQVVSRNNLHTGDDMGKLFTKYFLATFKNVTTDTRVLVKTKSYQGDITCGRFGFGIREHVQSSQIAHISGILEILFKNRGDVVDGLDKHKRWVKADEFDKFMDLLVNRYLFGPIELDIKLPRPATIIDDRHRLCVATDLRIHYSQHKSIACFARVRSGVDKRVSDSVQVGVRYDRDDDDYYGRGNSEYSAVLSNYALSDQFDQILVEFEKVVRDLCKAQQDMLQKLDDDFGKYVLAESL